MEFNTLDDIPDLREQGETILRKIQLVQLRLLEIFAWICQKHALRYWIDFGTLLGALRHGGFIPWDDDVDVSMPREDFRKFIQIAGQSIPNDIFMQTMQSDPDYDIYSVGMKLRDKYSTMIENPNGAYHQGIYIDIFPYDKTPANKRLRHFQQRLYKTLITGSYQNLGKKRFGERQVRKWLLQRIYSMIRMESVESHILGMYRVGSTFLYRPNLASGNDEYYFTEQQLFPLKTITFEKVEFSCPHDTEAWLTILYGDYRKLPPPEKQRALHLKTADPFLPCNHHDVLQWNERKEN